MESHIKHAYTEETFYKMRYNIPNYQLSLFCFIFRKNNVYAELFYAIIVNNLIYVYVNYIKTIYFKAKTYN